MYVDVWLSCVADGFLAKYCIFTRGNIEMYRHAFDAVQLDIRHI